MIEDQWWDQEIKSKYWWYSLCCHHLLNHYEELHAECHVTGGIKKLIEAFDIALQYSYNVIDEEDIRKPENKAIGIIDILINLYKSAERIHELLNNIKTELVESINGWNYTYQLEQFLQIGISLAEDFYQDGCRQTNLEIIDKIKLSNLPIKINLDNSYLSNYPHEHLRPITTLPRSREIYICFSPKLNFYTYHSYPILIFHEIASHIYVPKIKCEEFDDGWLLYANLYYLYDRISQIGLKYQLSIGQLNLIDRYWFGQFFDQIQEAYLLAYGMRAYFKDKFLPYTWDLASYPYYYNRSTNYHSYFLKVINLFNRAKNLFALEEALQNSSNASELLTKLEESLGFVLA